MRCIVLNFRLFNTPHCMDSEDFRGVSLFLEVSGCSSFHILCMEESSLEILHIFSIPVSRKQSNSIFEAT